MDLNYIRNRIHEILLGKIALGGSDDEYAGCNGGEGSNIYDMEIQQMRYGSGIKKRKEHAKKPKVKCKCGTKICRCKVLGNKNPIRPENSMDHMMHNMPLGGKHRKKGGRYYKAKQGRQGGTIGRDLYLPLIGKMDLLNKRGILGSGRAKKTKGKRQSAWITHVKKYAKEHDISYREALSKASASY